VIRILVDRFHARLLAPAWEQAQGQLQQVLRDLERILGVLHPRIEYPAPLLEDWVSASGSSTINTLAEQDIAGATITADTACSALGAFGHLFSFRLAVDGVIQPHRSNWTPQQVSEQHTIAHSWTVLALAGVATTIKLVARTSNVATTFSVNANSGFTIASFPLAYRLP
jgi:hypothetical protein